MKSIIKYILSVATVASIASCSNEHQWTVDGKIEGAGGKTMILEASDNGRWYPIDTISINSTGQFKATHAAAGYPDIYRLRLDNKTLYFPIDSIETVTVVTNADAFDHDYTLSGSTSAEMLMHVDKRVMDAVEHGGAAKLAKDSLLKRELTGMLLGDPAGIVSYYIINKRVGGMPIFDPADKSDLRVIGAVANAFNQYRPMDPRSTYLKNLFLSNRATSLLPTDTIVAEELGLLDIELYDNKGNKKSLSQTAADNRVVLLNFTAYGLDVSPALNVALNNIYQHYHNQGLEIYQIAFDGDEYKWRQAAKNLPWICVYNSAADGNSHLVRYNVGAIPAAFIIKNGTLAARITDISKIESEVARHI